MDGVIVDTASNHFLSWQYAFEKRGITFTEENFKSIFGQRNDTIIRRFAGQILSQDDINKITQDKEEFFRHAVKGRLKPFPGVVNLLITLKENGIGSAVASSAPLENIRLILSELHIEDYFQAIVFGLEVTEGKPSPQVFLLAAQKLKVEPGNCIVIEDAIAGVKAAKRAGMHCIAVTNSHPADMLCEADLVVDSLEKVNLRKLEKLFSE